MNLKKAREDQTKVYFYVPEEEMPEDFRTAAGEDGKGFIYGGHVWVLQTFIMLRKRGFDCELTHTLPGKGILVSHFDFLPLDLRPGKDLFIVCLKPDTPAHPYAQIHVVQNRHDDLLIWKTFFPSYYMTHWPQPGLIPRDPARGGSVKNVAFFGDRREIVPELKSPSWAEELKSAGMNWSIVDPNKWYDYREIDVLVAIRSFDLRKHQRKPATKLYNAWHAGVPAILGPDIAFRDIRKNELDYIEAHSPGEVLRALKRFKEDKDLYFSMVENGFMRAEEFTFDKITDQWEELFRDLIFPAYAKWRRSRCRKSQLYLRGKILLWIRKNSLYRPLRKKLLEIWHVREEKQSEAKR